MTSFDTFDDQKDFKKPQNVRKCSLEDRYVEKLNYAILRD